MRTDELDFELPAELIAQSPPPKRTDARLLHYRMADRSIAHRRITDLPGLLRRGDLLVFNDARVTPARFAVTKPTGGLVEGLFVAAEPDGKWRVMLKNLGPVSREAPLAVVGAAGASLFVERKTDDGQYVVRVDDPEPATLLARAGRMPLPPYIRRAKGRDERDEADRQRYQTTFARSEGSIAAPTAGLHFSAELLDQLDAAGVERAFVSLQVGLGTFKPVESETLDGHVMHIESYELPQATADAINAAKRDGRRVIAVGTTSARVLESQPAGQILARSDSTGIFIRPRYAWKHVDALLTNFHLPRSTLIALVAAMTGIEQQRRIYATAIAERYRFFSYGDALWIEGDAGSSAKIRAE